VAEDNGICKTERERERGACSGYLMLSGNKSVSVKKFESYRCCLKKCSFIKREEWCARTGERERESWARSVW
jgi:hypothetical protein